MDMPKFIKSWEKVDDLTVKLTLTEPNAPMLANLGMDFASIMSKEYADQLQAAGTLADFATKPVGTGPFQFVDYQLDSVIRYAAFPDYYKGKEKIDDLIFAITPDATTRMQKIAAGECDIMPYPNPADVAGAQGQCRSRRPRPGRPQHRLHELQHHPAAVRQGRSAPCAQPWPSTSDALIKALFQEAGAIPADNLIPPTMWSLEQGREGRRLRSGSRQEGARRRRRDRPSTSGLRTASRPYNPNFAARCRTDPGRLGHGRRHRHDHH